MGVGEWVVVGISIVIAAWFLIGNYLNQRKSQQVLAFLVKQFAELGKIASARFLAPTSAGYRAMVKFESGSFLQVEIVMGFQRRENLPLWLFQLVTGKPDVLMFIAVKRNAPGAEAWAFQNKSSSQLVEQANKGQNSALVFKEDCGGHRIYTRSQATQAGDVFLDILKAFPTIRIIGFQPKPPHLVVSLPMKAILNQDNGDFFNQIANIRE